MLDLTDGHLQILYHSLVSLFTLRMKVNSARLFWTSSSEYTLNTFQFNPIDDVLASRKVTLAITSRKSSTNVFENSGYTRRYSRFSRDCGLC